MLAELVVCVWAPPSFTVTVCVWAPPVALLPLYACVCVALTPEVVPPTLCVCAPAVLVVMPEPVPKSLTKLAVGDPDVPVVLVALENVWAWDPALLVVALNECA